MEYVCGAPKQFLSTVTAPKAPVDTSISVLVRETVRVRLFILVSISCFLLTKRAG